MICQRCGKEFTEDWRKSKRGVPTYCSKACAHARTFTEEAKLRKSQANKVFILDHPNHRVAIKNRMLEMWSTKDIQSKRQIAEHAAEGNQAARRRRQDQTQIKIQEYLDSAGEICQLSATKLRQVILDLRGHVCSKCGLGEIWQQERISLQIDHIDGDATNNKIENLRILCPNCHSQTSTWCSKNSGKSTRYKPK